jgi:DmsE family decaheme c-type cytochrome
MVKKRSHRGNALTRRLALFVIAIGILFAGCETLKISKPIIPQKEYERLIVGRFDADYVGTINCLKACHFHDGIKQDFEASTMGAQMSPGTGMPLVDCETCHGPGSLAIKGITEKKVQLDAREGRQTECDYETFINLENLPAPAQSLICLKCHTANATFNLHNWNAGEHAVNEVSCSDCHKIHAGPDLIVRPKETYKMCFECHEDVRAEFALPSRHPVLEGKVICTTCHDPHATTSDQLLRKDSERATCSMCHAEKEGPFVYEHSENTEDCTACHSPHGSVNNNLLTVRMPFLCLQCHEGHGTNAAYYARCTDCHSQIHGTDIPSSGGGGMFIQ